MKYEEFSTIYNALKSISSDESQSKDDVIETIKGQLSQDSGAYKEWAEGGFNLDHVFTTDGCQPQNTLLMRACQSVDLKVVDFLLKAGASVNVAAGDENPFTVAIEKEYGDSKHQGLVDLLIEKVNDHFDAADKNVNDTIVKAVERGNLRVFKYLVAKGVDIEVHETTLLEWAEWHKECVENKQDMDEIIGIINAHSKEKTQTSPKVAVSTSTNNSKQEDKAEDTTPTVSVSGTSSETSLKDEEIAQSTGANVGNQTAVSGSASTEPTAAPENNDASPLGNKKKDAVVNNVTTTPINGSASTKSTGNKAPGNNGAGFWSEHKGKIALGVVGLCVAGAVAAYVLAYPVVALVLTVLAAVILMGAGISKVLEDSKAEKHNTRQNLQANT